jgi:hypothetical protein
LLLSLHEEESEEDIFNKNFMKKKLFYKKFSKIFNLVIEKTESNQHLIKLVPQKFMNSYDYSLYLSQEPWNVYGVQPESIPNQDQLGYYGNWNIGDFLLHWPGIRNDKRIELAKYHTNQIIK